MCQEVNLFGNKFGTAVVINASASLSFVNVQQGADVRTIFLNTTYVGGVQQLEMELTFDSAPHGSEGTASRIRGAMLDGLASAHMSLDHAKSAWERRHADVTALSQSVIERFTRDMSRPQKRVGFTKAVHDTAVAKASASLHAALNNRALTKKAAQRAIATAEKSLKESFASVQQALQLLESDSSRASNKLRQIVMDTSSRAAGLEAWITKVKSVIGDEIDASAHLTAYAEPISTACHGAMLGINFIQHVAQNLNPTSKSVAQDTLLVLYRTQVYAAAAQSERSLQLARLQLTRADVSTLAAVTGAQRASAVAQLPFQQNSMTDLDHDIGTQKSECEAACAALATLPHSAEYLAYNAALKAVALATSCSDSMDMDHALTRKSNIEYKHMYFTGSMTVTLDAGFGAPLQVVCVPIQGILYAPSSLDPGVATGHIKSLCRRLWIGIPPYSDKT